LRMRPLLDRVLATSSADPAYKPSIRSGEPGSAISTVVSWEIGEAQARLLTR